MTRDIASILIAWLLGSIVFGVVLGRALRGHDPRTRDNPGASGSFRQFGPALGITVALLDLAKGLAAVSVGRMLRASPFGLAATAAATVAGHNWPVWFGFRGGGGLATLTGVLLAIGPVETLWALATTFAFAALYKLPWLEGRLPMSSLPFGSMFGLVAAMWLFSRNGNAAGTTAALLCAAIIGLRGLQMLAERRARG
ncbi:MAG: glycerol-3-phosphate acyltransferase [Bacillota bacterium]|nr:glycerol-3-phosphate acyltransferase [Bacillota bacterium]